MAKKKAEPKELSLPELSTPDIPETPRPEARPKRAKSGPKPVELDKKAFEALIQYGANKLDLANHFDVHFNTIANYCVREYKMTFEELQEIKMGAVRIRLRHKAIDMALTKNDRTMLIFCLKNLCKWSDNPDNNRILEENLGEIKDKISRIEYTVKKPVEVDESLYDK